MQGVTAEADGQRRGRLGPGALRPQEEPVGREFMQAVGGHVQADQLVKLHEGPLRDVVDEVVVQRAEEPGSQRFFPPSPSPLPAPCPPPQ